MGIVLAIAVLGFVCFRSGSEDIPTDPAGTSADSESSYDHWWEEPRTNYKQIIIYCGDEKVEFSMLSSRAGLNDGTFAIGLDNPRRPNANIAAVYNTDGMKRSSPVPD